jgi:hypothetical protein
VLLVEARSGDSTRSRLLGCTIVVASIVITGALLTACGAASEPLKALSSLGHLLPAPSPGKLGPELVPIPNAPPLGLPASTARVAKGEDGIKCEQNERLAFHIHVHLTAFVDGEPRRIPAGIGIWPVLQAQSGRVGQFDVTQGECLSWVATHFPDGIIHVEAPFKRGFTLGEFFDVWGQPLGPDVAGSAQGQVTAIVNGSVWTANPRSIPLNAHAQIQLEVGRPLVAPEKIRFPGGY